MGTDGTSDETRRRGQTQAPSIPWPELQRRVVHSLLLPAVRLAKVFGIPVKEIANFVHIAYFQELRHDGLTLQEVSERMDISMRSAARLSKQMKTNFFRPEREHELPRRIEFLLWYEPLSLSRIRRALPEVGDAALDEAMAQLLAEERVVRHAGRTVTYAVSRGASRIVRDRWTARIGALNSLVGNLSAVIYGRFFAQDPKAFARTLSFRLRRADLAQLKALYESEIWTRLEAMDEAAAGDPDALAMNFSVCWAEYESVPRAAVSPQAGNDHTSPGEARDDQGDDS